jgi:hypothetical protein
MRFTGGGTRRTLDCMASELEPSSDVSLDVASSELRADQLDTTALVSALAVRLEGALPRLVAVKRRKVGGFRSKTVEVDAIVLDAGDDRFELRAARGGYECLRHTVVRGITLKREPLALAEWIRAVVASVTHQAELREQDRIALERLVA